MYIYRSLTAESTEFNLFSIHDIFRLFVAVESSTRRGEDVEPEESSSGGVGRDNITPAKDQRKPTMDETLRKISLQLKGADVFF